MRIYAPVLWPDMVFYFSVSPDTSSRRIAAERAPGFYESGQDVTGISDPLVSYHAFVDKVMKEYANLALIFEFVTVNAEKSIYDQHKAIREMFQQNRRKPWAEWNLDAIREWVRDHPTYAQEAR